MDTHATDKENAIFLIVDQAFFGLDKAIGWLPEINQQRRGLPLI